jgi:hypothetical protein
MSRTGSTIPINDIPRINDIQNADNKSRSGLKKIVIGLVAIAALGVALIVTAGTAGLIIGGILCSSVVYNGALLYCSERRRNRESAANNSPAPSEQVSQVSQVGQAAEVSQARHVSPAVVAATAEILDEGVNDRNIGRG